MLLSVVILVVYFAAWAALHSLTASYAVKGWARRLFGGDRWYRLAYNALAVFTGLPLAILFFWLPDRTLYRVPAPWLWAMLAIEGLAALGIFLALLQTGLFSFLGLTRQPAASPGRLQVRGFYCWVRHPLYALGLVVIWLWPFMTVNYLTLVICFTIYLYVGSLFEEKRLLAEFGEAYRDYQRQVPRFLPRRGCRYTPPRP